MLFNGSGQFRARLPQVGLERLRLAAVEEAQSRVAFIAVPTGMVLIAFPINGGPSPVWGGVEVQIGEMVAFGPGERCTEEQRDLLAGELSKFRTGS